MVLNLSTIRKHSKIKNSSRNLELTKEVGHSIYFLLMKKVGLEARNVNMADIIHNAHPQSTLYINGRLSNNQIYNF